MKYALLIPLVIAAGLAAYIAFNTWRAKREQAQMKHDSDFVLWLDRVDAELRQYGANTSERDRNDWLIDFGAGLSAIQAAKNFIGKPTRDWNFK